MLGGTGAMGSPPCLPGAEQEAEQVVFPRREKAAYVPGSLARAAAPMPATPPMLWGGTEGPRGASDALQGQHRTGAAPWGILHEHPLVHPREDGPGQDLDPRICCRGWLAPGHKLMVTFTQSQQHLRQQQSVESCVESPAGRWIPALPRSCCTLQQLWAYTEKCHIHMDVHAPMQSSQT